MKREEVKAFCETGGLKYSSGEMHNSIIDSKVSAATIKKLVEACEYTLQNLDAAQKEKLITAPANFQIQLGESARYLREALEKYNKEVALPLRPLPPGTEIEYGDERAFVENDDGGDYIDVVDDGGFKTKWQWKLDGIECKVVKGPWK